MMMSTNIADDLHFVSKRAYYHLNLQKMQKIDHWLAQFRKIWEAQFNQLNDVFDADNIRYIRTTKSQSLLYYVYLCSTIAHEKRKHLHPFTGLSYGLLCGALASIEGHGCAPFLAPPSPRTRTPR